jgi:putative hemolysin
MVTGTEETVRGAPGTRATPAARYCAITGGQYTVAGQSNTPTEQGAGSFPNGTRCDAGAHYDGRCGR